MISQPICSEKKTDMKEKNKVAIDSNVDIKPTIELKKKNGTKYVARNQKKKTK